MTQGSPYGSQPSPLGNQNPYFPPQGGFGPPPEQWAPPAGSSPDVPGYCKVMFVVSLVLCFFRAVIVALGFVGMGVLSADDPAMKIAFLEVGTGLGMVLCGVPGNALLLARKQVGVYLGLGLAAFTVSSITTGIAMIAVSHGVPAAGGPPADPGTQHAELVGMVVGGGLSISLRVGILVAYAAALIRFQNWHTRYGRGA